MLNEVGIEHSKPLRASRIDLTFTTSDGTGGAPSAQIDGEEWPARRALRIDVDARAIRLVIPRGAGADS